MLTKQIQQHKNVIHCNQLGFVLGMQDWFNIWKLVLIDRIKDTNHIISVDADKFLTEVQHPFMVKLTKGHPQKLIADKIFNSKSLNAFLLSLKKGQELFHFLYNIILEVLASAIKQEKEIKATKLKRRE